MTRIWWRGAFRGAAASTLLQSDRDPVAPVSRAPSAGRGESWTRAEDERLCRLWAAGMSAAGIAAELTDRSAEAVKLRVRRLSRRGVVHGRVIDHAALGALRPDRAWARCADQVADLWMDGRPLAEIARAVGYSKATVCLALASLREAGEIGYGCRPWTAAEIAAAQAGHLPRGRTARATHEALRLRGLAPPRVRMLVLAPPDRSRISPARRKRPAYLIRPRWSEQEKEALAELIRSGTPLIDGWRRVLPRRSYDCVRKMAQALGLAADRRLWDAAEDALLLAGGAPDGRSPESCRKRLARLRRAAA
ncbi:MAG: hypothetical protein HQL40_14985 [Alphaproteobacteria bacterium]|nr:hypothetical protein [Alphaproteobacteria bacterium]